MDDATSFIEEATAEIADQVGDRRVLIALSGGVDSSVTAELTHRAVGERLTPVYVDTGLMRKDETEQIKDTFGHMTDLRVVEAQDEFIDALAGIIDPEEKRNVIGERFIRTFERVATEVDAEVLAQGTIYPDRIESEGNIKSHHNVGGLPDVVDFEDIVEPVRDLYKDEVRQVARELGLESIISERMPFPGPGLAVRVIGEQFIRTFEEVAREVDAEVLAQGTIYPDRIESEGNIKSHHNVGGLPDVVDFEDIVEPVRELYKDEVRQVARSLGLEELISERMPFPGPGLAVRVVGEVTREKLHVAREATHIVEEELEEHEPWQAFAAVLAKGTGVKGDNRVHGWIVSVRSVESRDGMTARAQELDWGTLQRIQSRITGQLDDVARVVYDVTHKPPATIEYE